jgi:hypothetical protein
VIPNVIEFCLSVKKNMSFNDAEPKRSKGTNDSQAFGFSFGTATSIFTSYTVKRVSN